MKNFFTNKGKLAGTLKDGIYRKKVNSIKHKMKMFDAYGVDKRIMLELQKEGCTEIRILETDTQIIYFSSLENFLKNGIEKNFDGIQIFLPIKFFQVNNSRQAVLV